MYVVTVNWVVYISCLTVAVVLDVVRLSQLFMSRGHAPSPSPIPRGEGERGVMLNLYFRELFLFLIKHLCLFFELLLLIQYLHCHCEHMLAEKVTTE